MLQSADLEFLCTYPVFEKSAMLRRVSDFGSKITEVHERLILPKGTMLHMVDNVGHSESPTDAFEIDDYPFLRAKSVIKHFQHFYDLEKIDPNDLGRFTSRILRAGLMPKLREFTKANRRSLLPNRQMETVVDNKNIILAINYNPLYRVVALQERPIQKYYQYQAIITTVLRNLLNYQDRNNFLVVPIPVGFEYNRTNMMSVVSGQKISPQKLINGNHFYFLTLDLLAYLLNPGTELSTFSRFNAKELYRAHLMFTTKDKAVIVNFGKLTTLADTKMRAFQFLDTLVAASPKVHGAVSPPVVKDTETELIKEDDAPDEVKIEHTSRLSPPKIERLIPTRSEGDEEPDDILTPDEIEDEAPDIVSTSTYDEPDFDFGEKDEELNEGEKPQPKFADRRETTPQQQGRAEVLASVMSRVKIPTSKGVRTIGDILDEPVDLKVEPTTYPTLVDDLPDPSMAQSKTRSFDQRYKEELFEKHLIGSLAAFKDNGLFISEYEDREEANAFTRVKHIKVKFEDVRGRRHTIKFKLPMPDDDGNYLVNGVKLSMSKQLVNIPICKVSPTRVSLVSNYNKTIVEKVQSVRYSLPEYLMKNSQQLGLTVTPKTNSYIGYEVPYDYRSMGSKFGKVITGTHEMYFEYPVRYHISEVVDVRSKNSISAEKMGELEAKHGVLFGKSLKDRTTCLFMDQHGNVTEVQVQSGNVVDRKLIIDYFGDIKLPAEWCELKILDKNIPIIMILAYRYGLSTVLSKLKVDYRFVPPRQKIELNPGDLVIPFSDGKLVINRYPLLSSYIVAGLLWASTLKRYRFRDMDDKDVFYHLLTDKGMSTNYLKGIDNYFNFFVDPITKDVLKEMKEPTNARDLLIRAVEMLIYDQDKEPSSISNFRMRSMEKLPAVVYNEISRQYANYVSSNYKDASFSINTEAIYQRILQDQTMVLQEETNPVHAIKEVSRLTYSGFGGRTEQSFVERDRRYPSDGIGILAETSTDSGSVGMVTALTGDPMISNLLGMFDVGAAESVTNKISDTSLLMPGAMHDDPKRTSFLGIQMTHHVPTKTQRPGRVRTGYEMVIAQKTSKTFAGKAKLPGKVIKVDEQLQLVTVQYADHTTEAFEYGEIPGSSPGLGINHRIVASPKAKVGQKVRQGDIITYHADFFTMDPTTGQLAWNIGTPAKVAIMAKDVTLEDSNMITKEFSQKLGLEAVYDRPIQLTTDMVVDTFVEVGAQVSYDDVLIRVKYESTADIIGEVDELYEELSQVEYKAKYEGTVVDIQVFHVSDELNPSLAKFVSKVNYKARRKAKATVGSRGGDKYQTVTKIDDGTRLKGVTLGDGDLLVVFYIKSDIGCGQGDKIILDSSLKTVIGKVSESRIETESGEPIDVVFSASSIFNRIILSPLIQAIPDRILEVAEQEALKLYFE